MWCGQAWTGVDRPDQVCLQPWRKGATSEPLADDVEPSPRAFCGWCQRVGRPPTGIHLSRPPYISRAACSLRVVQLLRLFDIHCCSFFAFVCCAEPGNMEGAAGPPSAKPSSHKPHPPPPHTARKVAARHKGSAYHSHHRSPQVPEPLEHSKRDPSLRIHWQAMLFQLKQ